MKKIFLGIAFCAGLGLSACGSHTATNAADGNKALLDSSKKTQDSTKADTAKKPDSTAKADTGKKM
ncbi:hypothetical protein [Mucilaginibacter sp.]